MMCNLQNHISMRHVWRILAILLLAVAVSPVADASLPRHASHSTPPLLPPPYPYAALRIEPDRLSVILYDGENLHEIDSVQVETKADTWYTVKYWHVAGGPNNGKISVVRTSDIPGDSVAMVLNAPRENLPSDWPIGFTVGKEADYAFQLVEYAQAPDTVETYTAGVLDALKARGILSLG